MAETETYQGWKNYPTWVVALWLDNDEGSYTYVRDLAEEANESDTPRVDLADALKELHHEHRDVTIEGVYGDLLGYVLDSVDWHEIADHYIDELDAEQADED